jgi:hypothetical protein
MAILLNNSTFNCVSAFGFNYATSGEYLYGLGVSSLADTCKNGSAVNGVFIGVNSGIDICCAKNVIAIGANVLSRKVSNKGGLCNVVAIGAYAMSEFNSGSGFCNSVGIGYRVFRCSVDIPNFNVAVGYRSMDNIGYNDKNVMIGNKTGISINGGSCNVAIGYCAGFSMYNNQKDLFIGYKAGQYISGNSMYNIIIGYCAGPIVGVHYGVISIGCESTTQAYYNYHTSFGNSNTTCNWVGATRWNLASDRYDKTEIVDLPDNLGLNFIRKLKPVKFKYDYRDRYVKKCGYEFGQKDGTLSNKQESYGFLAQEMKVSLVELGEKFDAISFDEFNDSYRLKNDDLIAPIIKSLKQTLDRLEIIENKIKYN